MSKVYCLPTASICAQTSEQTVGGHSYFTCRTTVLMMEQLHIAYSQMMKNLQLHEYTNQSVSNTMPLYYCFMPKRLIVGLYKLPG